MIQLTEKQETPLRQAIKIVGIGKKGSRALSPDLIQEILLELKKGSIPKASQGAFWGALLIKGLTKEEEILAQAFISPDTLKNPIHLINTLAPEVDCDIKAICIKLLKGETLDKETAKKLGHFLFSSQSGDGLRGLAASILRVRYETPEEYEGLLLSLEETFEPAFREPVPEGEPIIQIAEPFDGVDQSNMITPLLGEYLQKLGYRIVHLVGKNSGPKMGINLLDIAQNINAYFLKRNNDCTGIGHGTPRFGYFLNQVDLSKPMDRWVEIRREIIKRPFLATLERFVNPLKADIIIASAFHAPYGEKMMTICERAGFPGIIIIRNGIEGAIGFPLKRPAKILCSVRKSDNAYERYEINFDVVHFLGEEVALEEKLENPSIEKNVKLIDAYQKQGKTDNRHFDLRVKATCQGIKEAIEWILAHQ